MEKKLAIIVPCYNEEEMLPTTQLKLLKKLNQLISDKLIIGGKIYFVDDGSSDKTWSLIEIYCERDSKFSGIKLSKNFGHQSALIAGLFTNDCDVSISIDADLQDDLDVMDDMLKKYNSGCEIVYGVRDKREKDSFLKKHTALGYYKILNLLGVDIIYNHADYRLMSATAVGVLSEFKESNLFLRGLIPKLGFKTSKVYYNRGDREFGETKYPLSKMLMLAVDGITSFSVVPLRIITIIGILSLFFSVLFGFYALYLKLFLGVALLGWTTIILLITFFGGLNLFSLGVVGEYIGKIYMETKKRPRYIIEEKINK